MGAMNRVATAEAVEARFCEALNLQQMGDPEAALAAYDEVLEWDCWHVGALMHAAALALDLDRQQVAMQRYQELFNLPAEEIASAPEHAGALPDALNSLITLSAQVGRSDVALALLQAMTTHWPDNVEVRLSLGRFLMVAERPAEAAEQFRRATELLPERSDAWAGLGAALLTAGTVVRARRALERALALDPDDHGARRDLIGVLTHQKLDVAALPHYRELAARVDDDCAVLGQVGLALLDHEERETALMVFEKMLAVEPDNCLAGLGAGGALIALERKAEAIPRLEHALLHVPRDASLILSLSRVLTRHLPPQVCGAMLGGAIELAWNDVATLRDVVGEVYHRRHGSAAVKGLQRLHELVPDDSKVLPALIDAKLSVCDWGGGERLGQEVLSAVEERMSQGRPLDIDVWNLFAIGVDYPTLARAARYKSAQIENNVAAKRAACNFEARAPRAAHDGRIRIGYLCPYTIKTSHIDNLLTVVRHHDRERFALYGYSIGTPTDEVFEGTFKECFDGFRYTPLNRLEESARKIHDDNLDILIDSTGHFSASCMELAAMRPAPVIMHGTAGFNIIGAANFYDYSLNDRLFLSEDLVDLYVEQPIYMPHSAMPAERLSIVNNLAGRADFDIPEDVFVFADFNHPCKYDPKSFAAWMEILRRVPDSVLLLGDWVSDTEHNLHAMAAAQGVEPGRVMFMPFEVRGRHLRRLQLCDLALDTFYHCGGVTTVDCLIAGLPILTAVPDRALPLANRSLLAAMELEDMVMPDLPSYVERAVELALAPEALAAIRARMRVAQERAPLFQIKRWVGNLERSCEIMQRRHRDGDDPAPFSVLDVQDWPG